MRGGTGRLPGRDDARDPDMYMFLYFLSHTVYMEAGRFFRPVLPRRDPGFSNRDPGLERDDFCHINASSRLARDDIVLTLHYLH